MGTIEISFYKGKIWQESDVKIASKDKNWQSLRTLDFSPPLCFFNLPIMPSLVLSQSALLAGSMPGTLLLLSIKNWSSYLILFHAFLSHLIFSCTFPICTAGWINAWNTLSSSSAMNIQWVLLFLWYPILSHLFISYLLSFVLILSYLTCSYNIFSYLITAHLLLLRNEYPIRIAPLGCTRHFTASRNLEEFFVTNVKKFCQLRFALRAAWITLILEQTKFSCHGQFRII